MLQFVFLMCLVRGLCSLLHFFPIPVAVAAVAVVDVVASAAAVSVGFVGSACLGLPAVSFLSFLVGLCSLLFVGPACLVRFLLCFLLLLLFPLLLFLSLRRRLLILLGVVLVHLVHDCRISLVPVLVGLFLLLHQARLLRLLQVGFSWAFM